MQIWRRVEVLVIEEDYISRGSNIWPMDGFDKRNQGAVPRGKDRAMLLPYWGAWPQRNGVQGKCGMVGGAPSESKCNPPWNPPHADMDSAPDAMPLMFAVDATPLLQYIGRT